MSVVVIRMGSNVRHFDETVRVKLDIADGDALYKVIDSCRSDGPKDLGATPVFRDGQWHSGYEY